MTSNWMRQLEDELAAAELEDMLAPEAFISVHGVVRNTRRGLRFRVGGPVSGANLDNALWRGDGVFLVNATKRQAHQWAMRQAAQVGGWVERLRPGRLPHRPLGRPEQRHGQGHRYHFHIRRPATPGHPMIRSSHIFFGPLPSGDFLE
jgi:hypothetical protein